MGLTCQGSTTVIFILAFFFWFPLKINFLRAHHHHLLFKILAFPSHGQVQIISLLSPLATLFLFTFSLFLFIDQLLFVVIITVNDSFVYKFENKGLRLSVLALFFRFSSFSILKIPCWSKWSALVFGTS